MIGQLEKAVLTVAAGYCALRLGGEAAYSSIDRAIFPQLLIWLRRFNR